MKSFCSPFFSFASYFFIYFSAIGWRSWLPGNKLVRGELNVYCGWYSLVVQLEMNPYTPPLPPPSSLFPLPEPKEKQEPKILFVIMLYDNHLTTSHLWKFNSNLYISIRAYLSGPKAICNSSDLQKGLMDIITMSTLIICHLGTLWHFDYSFMIMFFFEDL